MKTSDIATARRMAAPLACWLRIFIPAHGRRHHDGIAVDQFHACTKAAINGEIRRSQQNFGLKSQDRAGAIML